MNTASTETRGVFRPRRTAHVNFWVENVDDVIGFYNDVAGIEEVYRRPAIKAIFLSNGNTYHDTALFDVTGLRGEGRTNGLHHFAVELESEAEMVEDFQKVAEFGYEFDFALSADVAHSLYGHDPEGNRCEVYADVKPNWRELRTGVIDAGSRNPPWEPGATEPVAAPCYPVDPEIVVTKDAVFHTKRGSHLAIIVNDMDAMYRHYNGLIGMTPMVGSAADDFVMLCGSTGEECVALFRKQAGWEPGYHHGSFELIDDAAFDRGVRLCGERGIDIVKIAEHPARRAVHIKDPCGNKLQFFVDGDAPLETLTDLPPEEAIWLG